jgi:adenylylsulfate kinase
MTQHTIWHQAAVRHEERVEQNAHQPCVLWYTGLSGAGKSTLANAVDRILFDKGCHTYVLDGDNVRHGLNQDLGFDRDGRTENIRRIAEVARLFADAGTIVSTAFISPFRADRTQAREVIGKSFIEIFVDTPLSVCEQRDPKGLYQKARSGEVEHFTGVTSPYQIPDSPELEVHAAELSIEAAAEQVIHYLMRHRIINEH